MVNEMGCDHSKAGFCVICNKYVHFSNDSNSTSWELDVRIEKGHEKDFENYMYRMDIKNLELTPTTIRSEDTRYSVTFRAFSPIQVRSGSTWEIKNTWKLGEDTKAKFIPNRNYTLLTSYDIYDASDEELKQKYDFSNMTEFLQYIHNRRALLNLGKSGSGNILR